MAVAASDIGRQSGAVSDHQLTGRILAELRLARSKLERALSPGSRLFPAVRALTRMAEAKGDIVSKMTFWPGYGPAAS